MTSRGPIDCTADCPTLGWAASGAMALTGFPSRPPVYSPGRSFGAIKTMADRLAVVTSGTGAAVRADPAELITARAGLAGLTRRGQVSAGGATRLLWAADGWCAVTLSRPDDVASVPAILGRDDVADPWTALAAAAASGPAADLTGRAQLLGVPAAALPPRTDGREPRPEPAEMPWRTSRIADAIPGLRLDGALVVDLSSMWAGPLCARLLGQAGARVVKVESVARPDGARAGEPRFFDWLHCGQASVQLDLGTERETLARLLAAADIVIEASRPRALAQLGLAPGQRPHRPGQVWVSITGYGRGAPDRVAFGDDAAVAGGLVGWDDSQPVFAADALADPLAGLAAALAVATSVAAGGGELIDLSMQAVAAMVAAAPTVCPGPHQIRGESVHCERAGEEQTVLPPRAPRVSGVAAEAGADTRAVLAGLPPC